MKAELYFLFFSDILKKIITSIEKRKDLSQKINY